MHFCRAPLTEQVRAEQPHAHWERERYLELQAGMGDREGATSTSKSSEDGTCVGSKNRVRIEQLT